MRNDLRSPTSLQVIERQFNELTAQPAPLSLDGCRIGLGLPPRLIPLDELRITLLKRQTSSQLKDAVWRELAQRAQEKGDPWTTAAIGMMMPALKRIAGNVTRRFPGDIADFDSDIVEGFLQALNSADPDTPRLYSSLRFMAHRYGMEARTREDRISRQNATYDDKTLIGRLSKATGHPDLVLAQAVLDDELSNEEAGLIGRARLDGEGTTSLAQERGVSPYQFRQELARAERRLITFLGQQPGHAAA